MRDIKFRAWYKAKKMMMYRGVFDRNWYTESMAGKCIQGIHPDDAFNVDLMQFTGIKDIYGVEIYEGDIASVSGIKGLFEVELEGLRGVILLDNILVNSYLEFIKDGRKITIVGNKYENPELLEQLR